MRLKLEYIKSSHRDNLKKTLNAIERYKAADSKIKQICKEKGLKIPELVI